MKTDENLALHTSPELFGTVPVSATALVRAGRRAVLAQVVERGVVCRNGFDTCPEWYPGETAKWCDYCWATAQLEEKP